MPNIKHPVVNSIRILPENTEFLDRKVGARGQIFVDNANSTLRVYDGETTGGISLLRADLANIEGAITATVESSAPAGEFSEGAIWFNTSNNKLYVLYNGNWVESASSGGPSTIDTLGELTDVIINTPTTVQVLQYNGTNWVNGTDNTASAGATLLDELSDVAINTPAAGQILKYNGTSWVNDVDSTGSASEVTGIVAGTGISINPLDGKGNVTISAAGISEFANLSDANTATLTIDKIAYQAITRLDVTPNGATAYLFTQYSGNNPTIYAITGTTIAFNLAVSGHPFLIQDSIGDLYSNGLVHVSTVGVISTGAAAQGQRTGTLYWQIPKTAFGSYRYQCSLHVPMVGSIIVKDIAAL